MIPSRSNGCCPKTRIGVLNGFLPYGDMRMLSVISAHALAIRPCSFQALNTARLRSEDFARESQRRALFETILISAVVKPPLLWLFISVYSRLPGRSLGEGWSFAGQTSSVAAAPLWVIPSAAGQAQTRRVETAAPWRTPTTLGGWLNLISERDSCYRDR